jgi:hypothetical protein
MKQAYPIRDTLRATIVCCLYQTNLFTSDKCCDPTEYLHAHKPVSYGTRPHRYENTVARSIFRNCEFDCKVTTVWEGGFS